jgi:hypothetical protein
MDIAYIDQAVGKKWLDETDKISSMLGDLMRAKNRDAQRETRNARWERAKITMILLFNI